MSGVSVEKLTSICENEDPRSAALLCEAIFGVCSLTRYFFVRGLGFLLALCRVCVLSEDFTPYWLSAWDTFSLCVFRATTPCRDARAGWHTPTCSSPVFLASAACLCLTVSELIPAPAPTAFCAPMPRTLTSVKQHLLIPRERGQCLYVSPLCLPLSLDNFSAVSTGHLRAVP